MTTSPPLLVLAYNREDHLRRLVSRLRVLRPEHVMIAVDGPKTGNAADAAKVAAVRRIAESVDWTDRVETRFRGANMGLRSAVADAVSWAVEKYGSVIVVEDDVEPGADFLPYMTQSLRDHADDERISHISGYNLVPPDRLLTTAGSRLTLYPESFAWGTWARAWKNYDPAMQWGANASVAELAAITGSTAGGIRWKQHFSDAANERISTWAYRWIASMWSKGALTLSPNSNLVTYTGYDEGTHTTLDAPWSELQLYSGDPALLRTASPTRDTRAEDWVGRTVFGESPYGVLRGAAISTVLAARKTWRSRRR